ncbi:hypothetical protein LBMAG56_14190 [Verrucomicrobiota bacterium]|nr:hypothetical protein LBMAG56_14190 [Verrucomicrobiota bacterium]
MTNHVPIRLPPFVCQNPAIPGPTASALSHRSDLSKHCPNAPPRSPSVPLWGSWFSATVMPEIGLTVPPHYPQVTRPYGDGGANHLRLNPSGPPADSLR